MVGGEDFFKDTNDDFSKGGSSSFGSISQKSEFIEKIFKKVLGRKPTSKEISFYKVSAISEEKLFRKLVESDEHKKIVKNSNEFPELEQRLKNSEASNVRFNQKLEDVTDEIVELKNLLREKNNIIIKLRGELKNPYSIPTRREKIIEGFDVNNKLETKEEVSPLKKILKLIFD